jgi:hypothetical protein
MKRTRKSDEPSLRDRLTSAFVEALEREWTEHGPAAIAQVREQQPSKYAELIVRLVPVEPLIIGGEGDFSGCQTEEDIACKLLTDVGALDVGITPSMIEQATELQLAFLRDLEHIAGGH